MAATQTAVRGGSSSVIRSSPGGSGLYEVLELILDKGLVIDAYARVSLVGIELLTVDARVVIASVDTYLRFAEAVDRLNIRSQSDEETTNLQDLAQGLGRGAKSLGAKGTASSVVDKVGEFLGGADEGGDDEGDDERERSGGNGGRRRPPSGARSRRTRPRARGEDE